MDEHYLLILIILLVVHRFIHPLLQTFAAAITWMVRRRVPVEVHVGSGTKSFRLKIRLLTVEWYLNPLRWNTVNYYRGAGTQLVYSVGDAYAIALASFVTPLLFYGMIAAVTFILHIPEGSTIRITLALMGGYQIISSIQNYKVVIGADGREVWGNGYTMKLYYQLKNLPDPFDRASMYYYQGNYQKAMPLLEEVIDKGVKHPHVLRRMIEAYLYTSDLHKAYQTSLMLELTREQTPNDMVQAGLIKGQLGLIEESILDFNKAIEKAPGIRLAYDNRGFASLLLGNYTNALNDFNRSVVLDSKNAYAYCNRGLAKIKLGNTEEGLGDIEHALKLDPDNAYAYRNMGIYFYERGEFRAALPLFERAKKLDSGVVDIGMYLSQTRERLRFEIIK